MNDSDKEKEHQQRYDNIERKLQRYKEKERKRKKLVQKAWYEKNKQRVNEQSKANYRQKREDEQQFKETILGELKDIQLKLELMESRIVESKTMCHYLNKMSESIVGEIKGSTFKIC